jgi:hypothetical protein
MTFLQSQFDKILMTFLVLVMCSFAYSKNEKLVTFALQAASGCMGSLITLVVTKRHSETEK